jgi:predicted ATPase/DNA-binding CsgD family transcriptional regulator
MQDFIEGSWESTIGQKQEPLWNVPTSLTSIIGREEEITSICALLALPDVRLLTILGPGGIGKTRLGIEVMTRVRALFVDGVCYVALASIKDPSQVLLAIAQALDIPKMEAQPLLHLVTDSLCKKRILLLLDNFEQLLAAAQDLVDILAACPGLKMLVTSRAKLHVQGEQEYQLQPLSLPSPDQPPEYAMLTRYAAVTLFLQRAQAQMQDFRITQANALAIVEICIHLDGLPLAIELAAARIKILPPQALLARLDRRLQLLTGGPHTLPVRQQTLRDTLNWSYDLLDSCEQQLFRRLSVFERGCSLAAIECLYTMLSEDPQQVLDDASSLVDKSLLQQTEREGNEPRLMMLETIREYGLERLAESEEAETIYRMHAAYYLALAEQAEAGLEGLQQAMWMRQLEREHDNLRVALLWAITQKEGASEPERQETALRLVVALRRFWLICGYISEGQYFLEHALAMNEVTDTLIYAKALLAQGTLVSIQGDYSRARALCTRSLELFRKFRDPRSIAAALYQLGHIAWMRGDLKYARSLAEDALISSKTSQHDGSIAWSLFRLARLLIEQGEYARGRALLEENLTLHTRMGNKRAIAVSLYHLAWVNMITQADPVAVRSLNARAQGIFKEVGDKEGIAYCLYLSGQLALTEDDSVAAFTQLQESELLFREMLHKEGIARTLSMLGRIATLQADYKMAHDLYRESLEITWELDYKGLLAFCIEGFAALVTTQATQPRSGEEEDGALPSYMTCGESPSIIRWAVQLWGVAEALHETAGLPVAPVDRALYDSSMEVARRQLGEASFATAWSEGRTMSPMQALSKSGLVEISIPVASTPQVNALKVPHPDRLTPRELEVLELVAQGLTSAQIADRLVLSQLTVNSHVRSIYSKLGITSRSSATRYAITHNLV